MQFSETWTLSVRLCVWYYTVYGALECFRNSRERERSDFSRAAVLTSQKTASYHRVSKNVMRNIRSSFRYNENYHKSYHDTATVRRITMYHGKKQQPSRWTTTDEAFRPDMYKKHHRPRNKFPPPSLNASTYCPTHIQNRNEVKTDQERRFLLSLILCHRYSWTKVYHLPPPKRENTPVHEKKSIQKVSSFGESCNKPKQHMHTRKFEMELTLTSENKEKGKLSYSTRARKKETSKAIF